MEIINVPEDDLEEIEKVEYVDDSYILPQDKKELIKVIKDIYRKSMPWADDQLFKCTVLHHYNEVISKMDKEAYLSEINETNVEDLF